MDQLVNQYHKTKEALIELAIKNGTNFLVNYLRGQLTTSVKLTQSDHTYQCIGNWLWKQRKSNMSHLSNVVTDPYEDETNFVGSPAEDWYVVWHEGTPLLLHYGTVWNKMGSYNMTIGKTLDIWCYRGKMQTILRFIDEVTVRMKQNEDRSVSVYVSQNGYWEQLHSVNRRPLESVVLPSEQKENIIQDIDKFFADEDWYINNAVPFRRGYLLHGLAGTGKSSIILALASHFDLPLYILNLADPELDDTKLQELFASCGNNVAILLEDVDTLSAAQRTGGKSKLSFSALLNVIDGVTASQDRILFMTTNKVDELDSALVRPGRIDYRIEFGTLTQGQADEMIHRFYPELKIPQTPSSWSEKYSQMVASELQKLLIECRHAPESFEDALVNYVPSKKEL